MQSIYKGDLYALVGKTLVIKGGPRSLWKSGIILAVQFPSCLPQSRKELDNTNKFLKEIRKNEHHEVTCPTKVQMTLMGVRYTAVDSERMGILINCPKCGCLSFATSMYATAEDILAAGIV